METKLRVLEVDLPHLAVTRHQHLPSFQTFEGLGSFLVRGKQSKLADDLAGWNFDPGLGKSEQTTDRVVERVGFVAFPKQHIAGLDCPAHHEWLEPFE